MNSCNFKITGSKIYATLNVSSAVKPTRIFLYNNSFVDN